MSVDVSEIVVQLFEEFFVLFDHIGVMVGASLAAFSASWEAVVSDTCEAGMG